MVDVTPEDIKHWLEAGLNNAQVAVEGDGRHFFATIISDEFSGVSTLKRHRLVYDVLGERMKEDIHALSIKTYTQAEYQPANQ